MLWYLSSHSVLVTPQSFLGRFYFNFYLRVFPSWEPLMDYETSAIHLFLFFILIKSAPKRSGGSETSIMSSSFTSERPHVRFEVIQCNTNRVD
jgi:hypothetical protein